MVICEAPPTSTVAGAKLLLALGAVSGLTVSVPLALAPDAALLLVIGPVLLTNEPIAIPTTLIRIEQLPFAGMTPPANEADVPPSGALTAPLHVLLANAPLAMF